VVERLLPSLPQPRQKLLLSVDVFFIGVFLSSSRYFSSLPVAELSLHQTKAVLDRFFPDFSCIQQT
jgi:hypothetical protein